MALMAVLIKLESPGPVLFAQERSGKNGNLFTIYKFRSMVDGAEHQKEVLQDLNEADGPLFKIKDDPRITRLGKFIRRLSIDELPQLYNVLVGDMSLIGPRPPIPSEVENYQEWHKRRLEIAPGLTGLSQISGRSAIDSNPLICTNGFGSVVLGRGIIIPVPIPAIHRVEEEV